MSHENWRVGKKKKGGETINKFVILTGITM